MWNNKTGLYTIGLVMNGQISFVFFFDKVAFFFSPTKNYLSFILEKNLNQRTDTDR